MRRNSDNFEKSEYKWSKVFQYPDLNYANSIFDRENGTGDVTFNVLDAAKKLSEKMIFKGSCPGLNYKDFILRYLGSTTRLRPQIWYVGSIFDVQQTGHDIFPIVKIFQ